MCCSLIVFLVKRVSAKANRDTVVLFISGSPVTRLTVRTAGTKDLGKNNNLTWSNGFCSVPGAFEDTSFSSLSDLVSENTLKGVKEMGFEQMTEIQHKTIRPLLEGRYVSLPGQNQQDGPGSCL